MKIPVTNAGSGPMFVGALMVAPGETRLFEESEVPAHLKPQPEAPAAPQKPADPAEARKGELAELLEHKVADVAATFENLNDADLAVLGELETAAEKPRISLLQLVAEEQMKRAGGGG